MMLFPTLFALFAIGAAFSEEQNCRDEALMNCNVMSIPDEIPETMEDLQKDCKFVQDAIKCMLEEQKRCELTFFQPERMIDLAQFMEKNCDKDSSLFQALSRNFDCIQPIAHNVNYQCKYYKVIDKEDMEKMASKAGGLPRTAEGCEYPLFEITCIGYIFDMQCGQEAKEVVTEILQNTNYDFKYCNEESILRDLQPLKEVFESTLTATHEVENGILKKIKVSLSE